MAGIAYLDFDVEIERVADGYRVEVDGPSGQASHQFTLPFSDLELENFILRMGQSRGGRRRVDSPEVQNAKKFGGRLFDAVFGAELGQVLRSSLDEAARQSAGLRIRLRLNDAPELADVPWEYLYHSALNRFLTLSAKTPIVRYLELPERVRPLLVTPPLRVLVLIAGPWDYAPLDAEREWNNLQTALGDLQQRGLVVLERLEQATLAALQQQIRRGAYNIFHFIGHGGFDEERQDGVLILEGDGGAGHAVGGQELGTLLFDHDPLRLAVLNACEGGRASRSDPFAGVAQSLVQQGTPAVVAMQFEVTDKAAITLAQAFYGAVADGYPVDAALAEARRAIFAEGNGVEWGTPVLYMRAPDGRVFDIASSSAAATSPRVMVQAPPAPILTPPEQNRAAAPASPPMPRSMPAAGRSKHLLLSAALVLLALALVLILPRLLGRLGVSSSIEPGSGAGNSGASAASATAQGSTAITGANAASSQTSQASVPPREETASGGPLAEATAGTGAAAVVGESAAGAAGVFSVAIGDTVEKDAPAPGAGYIETAGTTDVYIFSAKPGERVFFRSAESATAYIPWMMTDEAGKMVFQGSVWRDPGAITLDRGGTYTIVVGNDTSTELGTYKFKLWAVPQPDRFTLTVGDSVAKDLPGTAAGYIETFGAKDIYTFTATAGQTVVFAFEGSSGHYIPWVVTDELGAKVFEGSLGSAQGAVKLDRGGTYTITVGGDTSLELGAYGFRLAQP